MSRSTSGEALIADDLLERYSAYLEGRITYEELHGLARCSVCDVQHQSFRCPKIDWDKFVARIGK